MTRSSLLAAAACVAVAQATTAVSAIEIDAMKHNFREINAKNFDSIVSHAREVGVSAVWYFKKNNRADDNFVSIYNEVATKIKGMVTMAAMNCDAPANKAQCDRDGVTETPHIQVYPPLPQPQYKLGGGELPAAKLEKRLLKLIPNKVTTVTTPEEYKAFTQAKPTQPKVILFSDKEKAPTILKALAAEVVFHRTLSFAFVSSTSGDGAKQVIKDVTRGKKKLPAFMIFSKKKKEWYKSGKAKAEDLTFANLHSWINLQSESGMGDQTRGPGGAEEEEMEYERLRELTGKSSKDVCFGQKAVCGIYLKKGPIEEKETDMVLQFEQDHSSSNDRAMKYTWAWMDIDQEPDFKAALDKQEEKHADREGRDVEPLTYPTMIFIKPPKKKREAKLLSYVRIESGKPVNDDTVASMVERIGGGATYQRADLPKFASRPKVEKKAKKTEL